MILIVKLIQAHVFFFLQMNSRYIPWKRRRKREEEEGEKEEEEEEEKEKTNKIGIKQQQKY